MFADEAGTAVGRLPADCYDLEVYWHGNLIGAAPEVVLSTNLEMTLIGEVCSVNIVTIDSEGLALSDAHVVVKSASDVIASMLTNDSGAIHVILPVGTLEIETFWYGVLVNETQVTLDGDANVIIACSVSYLEVVTHDSDGKALDGVEVLVKDSQGNALGYGLTADGAIKFRFPDQTVGVEGHFVSEYMTTHVDLTESATVAVSGDSQVTLTFDHPPGVLSTVVFSIALLGAIAGVLALALILLLLRMRRRGVSYVADTGAADPLPANEAAPPPPPLDLEAPSTTSESLSEAPARSSSNTRKKESSRRKKKQSGTITGRGVSSFDKPLIVISSF
jgi:hypothetical protein